MPRFCCGFAPKHIYSTQSEFAQHWITLWFNVATTEQFFAKRQEQTTRKNLALLCTLALLAQVGLFVYLITLELPSDLARAANKINIGAVVGEAMLTTLLYLTCWATARNPCLPPIVTEVSAVVFLMLISLLLFPVDTWYATKLMGQDPAEVWGDMYNFSDTRTLLALSSMVLGSHIALPIRWVVFLPLAAVSVFIYAGFAFGLGGPDGFHAWSSLMLFAALNTTGVIGRRTIETHEREALHQLINERNKRVETEFQLSQLEEQVAHPETRGGEEDHQSVRESRPETTDSALVFEKGDLDSVVELGRKEQWYIDQGEFRLTSEVLGQGSFGSVVAGSFYGSPVAVKFARGAARGSTRKSPEKLLITLLNEVRILRRLRHPNIVLFHGACKDSSSMGFSLVLERVQGLPLDTAVVEGKGEWTALTLRDRFRAIVDTCRALCYLHSRLPPIVHGDLKASNTFAEMETGRPGLIRAKLLDFGLSRSLTRHAKPLGGSLMWMAPEVARGQSTPQKAGDVYSFGRLVYFASTRRFPKPTRDGRGAWKLLRPGNSDLVWPVDTAGALVQICRPIVGTCCSYEAGLRPSMMQISQQLQEVDPEAVASGDRTEGSEGSPLPPPLPPPATLAETPAKMPVEASAEATTGSPGETPALGRSTRGNPGSGASSSALSQVMEVDKPVPNELAIPSYHATPNFTAFALVLEAAGRVNFRVPSGNSSCCLHHATLRHMVEVIEDLSRQGCKPSPFSYRKTQCPQCYLLLDMNDDDDVAANSDEEEGSGGRADDGKAVLACPSCGLKVEVDRQQCQ